ncbi:hypothetical protein DT87_23720 [Streptomyces sp. NTK 937]|nr:hypothetical protein DT87_23720 [Streptomyces sp. NTK 937]
MADEFLPTSRRIPARANGIPGPGRRADGPAPAGGTGPAERSRAARELKETRATLKSLPRC